MTFVPRPRHVSLKRRAAALTLALTMQALFVGIWLTSRRVDAPSKPPSLVMIDLPPQSAPVTQPASVAPPVLLAPHVEVSLPPLPQVALAPTVAPAETAITAVAEPSLPAVDVVENYESALLRHLNAHKRYPATARARRQEGVVTIRFTMDREGRLLARAVDKSSRIAALDQEGLMLLDRAQPLPTPPSKLAGAQIELVVPINFLLR